MAEVGVNLGGTVLRRFKVIVDYPRQRVILEPNARLHDPFPADASGLVLTATGEEQDSVRQATIGVTAIAGFCGLPEVTLPAATVGGVPIGLSLVAAPGHDRGLLSLACDAASVLGLPV